MRPKNPVALTIAAVAAFLLLAVAVLWVGARTGMARRAAGDYLTGLTGLPVAVDSMALDFLPVPGLELGGVTIAQPPGFGAEPLIEVGTARATIPWSAVFRAEAVLRSVSILDATIRPALAIDGADNWSALIERLTELAGEGELHGSVERLDVERGALEFHDAATGSRWRLTAIAIGADAIAPAVNFPIDLRFAGVRGANTLHVALTARARLDPDAGRYEARDLTLRGWIGGDPLPLAGVELVGAIAVASIDQGMGIVAIKGGTMTFAGIRSQFELDTGHGDDETGLDFALTTAPFSPRVAAAAFGQPLAATADPRVFQILQFGLRGRMEQGRIHLDPIDGRLDDTQWSGSAIPELRRFRLRADALDLDRYLPPEETTGKEKKATLETALAELGKLDVDAEIRIGEARVAGAKLRDALLKVERNEESSP